MDLSTGGIGGTQDATSDQGPTLAGRQTELALLERALSDAQTGQGRTILLSGEAGIGKTTLAEALSERARRQGATVVWGRCWEGGGAPAYWPWVQALRTLLAQSDMRAEVESARPFLDVLATLVPEVAGPGPARRSQAAEGDHERFVLFDAISRVFQAAASSRPLVVILDDLHAADHSSVLLLRFIARDIRSSRCLLIATYREREVRAGPTVSTMLDEVGREGQTIALTGLESDELASVLERTAGVSPSDALRAALHQMTDGNPFYANEILRLLLREGRLETRLDLTRRVLPVPESVSGTVLRRVRTLDGKVQGVLQVAAVIGREFSIQPLAKASGLPVLEVRSLLTVAESERVVRPIASGRYLFDHGLIRESLYESLSEEKRAALHGRVAEALESEGVSVSGENLAEIAHHYLRAALVDARPPYDYALRAGARALDVLAYEQAVDLFEDALALVPLVDASLEERSQLLIHLGEALLRSGRITESREKLLEAAALARSAASTSLLARAAIIFGYSHVEGGIANHEYISLIKEALEALGPEESRERALLLARWGHELMLSGKQEEAKLSERLSAEGLDMIRRVGEPHEIGRVLRNRFSVALAPHRLDECAELADEILRLGLAGGDLEMQLVGRLRRAAVFLLQGNAAEMDAEVKELQRLAEVVRQPLHSSPIAFFRACLAAMRAGPVEGLKASDAAMGLGSDIPNAMGAHLLQHVTLRWQTDGGADFEPFMRAAMEQRPGIRRAWAIALAVTAARVGRKDEAASLLREMIDDLPNTPMDSVYMATLHCGAEVFRTLRQPQQAEILYDALSPYRDQHITQVMVSPVIYYGAAAWDLGTLASLLGRWEDAENHFKQALEMHARIGARPQLAWTQAEYAELLLKRGDPKDAPQARGFISESLQTARTLGLTVLENFVSALETPATEIDLQRAQPKKPASMVREGEYVTISFGDELVRLKASKGLDYLSALLASPTREIHVLEIASQGAKLASASTDGLELFSDDAGALLDPEAKAAYKKRIIELREDVEEAEAFNDPVRVERAREELEFITEQLAGAVGLGGRDRKVASSAERARVNVTKRIKTTLEKISRGAPGLGRHLEATIKTGTFLSYSDRLEPTLEWHLSSMRSD